MGAEGSVTAEDCWLVHLLLSQLGLCEEPVLASWGSPGTPRERGALEYDRFPPVFKNMES